VDFTFDVAGPAMKISKERSAEIRRELLDSTAKEILQVGFSSITMAQIASNCDIAVSTITNRFRDKFELIDALVAEVIEPELGQQFDAQTRAFWSGETQLPTFNQDQMGVISELTLAATHTPQLRPIIGPFLTARATAGALARDEAAAVGLARPELDPNGQLFFQLATSIGHYIASLTSTAPQNVRVQINELIRLTLLDLPLASGLSPSNVRTPRAVPALPERSEPLDEVGKTLIDSARTTFSKQGYEGSNLQEIARATGHTTGAIYSRFTGKADLMRTLVLESVAPSSLSSFNATRSLIESLGSLTDESLGNYLARLNSDSLAEERALRLVARDAARRESAIAEVVGPLQDIHLALLADVFRNHIESGLLRADLDPESLAWWMVSFPVAVNLLGDVFPESHPIDWLSLLTVTNRALMTHPQ